MGQETLSFITGSARPGNNECGVDLLSRVNPRHGEWTLHPQVVGQLWKRFGRVAEDLFASHENSHCPLFFLLTRDGHTVILSHTDCPELAGEIVAGGANAALGRPALASPAVQRPPLASSRGDISPRPRQSCSLVIETIQNVRAASTYSAYDRKLNVVEEWCAHKLIVPFLCSTADVLCSLQELLDKGRAFLPLRFISLWFLRVMWRLTITLWVDTRLYAGLWEVHSVWTGCQNPWFRRGTCLALFKGVSFQDIFAAACCASPHTIVRFYRLDVTEPLLAHSILSV